VLITNPDFKSDHLSGNQSNAVVFTDCIGCIFQLLLIATSIAGFLPAIIDPATNFQRLLPSRMYALAI